MTERVETPQDTAQPAVAPQAEAALDDRRDAMKRLGRYALYTAPAMLVLFESTKAPAASPLPP